MKLHYTEHIVSVTKELGPTAVFQCYTYESKYGINKDSTHGSRSPEVGIAKFICTEIQANILLDNLHIINLI